ncbi:MATE family efflux transporter [Hellea sp.]|nr:MATE family efflux transporter [Hellea sp.]
MSETLTHNPPQKAVLPKTWWGEMRALLWIGVPMAAAQFIQFFVYFIDTVMIGRISPQDVAAAGLGSVIYFAFWMLGSGPVMAVSPLVSQAMGADQNDTRDARRSVRMVIWVIFLMTPILVVMLSFTEELLLFFGQDAQVSAKAGKYVMALAIGLPFALATMALRNFLAALEKTLIPLLLVVIGTAANGLLNYIFIFGNFGVPRLELVGAGIASSLAYIFGFCLFVLYIRLDKRANSFQIFKNFWRSDWQRLKEVITLGWPMSLTTTFEGMLFNAAIIVMGLIGVLEAAAYQIALNVAALAFMLPYGMSMAGAVRIGLAEGAGNKPATRRAASTTIVACIFAIMILAIPVALFPEFTASLYLNLEKPENAEVIALVVGFLPIATAFMFFDSVQVAANQLLRGLKDVNWPMVFTGISYWVVGFPVAYILALKTEVGANGVWYGLMAGLITAAVLLGARLLRRLR